MVYNFESTVYKKRSASITDIQQLGTCETRALEISWGDKFRHQLKVLNFDKQRAGLKSSWTLGSRLHSGELITKWNVIMIRDIWVIDQVWAQDGWILAKFFFACLWVETDINSQKKRGQYPAIVTEPTWSTKELLHGFRGIFLAGYSG